MYWVQYNKTTGRVTAIVTSGQEPKIDGNKAQGSLTTLPDFPRFRVDTSTDELVAVKPVFENGKEDDGNNITSFEDDMSKTREALIKPTRPVIDAQPIS